MSYGSEGISGTFLYVASVLICWKYRSATMGEQQEPCRRASAGIVAIEFRNSTEQLLLPCWLRKENRCIRTGSTAATWARAARTKDELVRSAAGVAAMNPSTVRRVV